MKKEKISEGIFITKEIREVIDIRDKYWRNKLLVLKKEIKEATELQGHWEQDKKTKEFKVWFWENQLKELIEGAFSKKVLEDKK